MLSYILPVNNENSGVVNETDRLKLDPNQSPSSPERKVYQASAASKESSTCSFASSDNTGSSMTHNVSTSKHKILNNGNKLISFKRVSFGSSKGSMVETMIYEKPLKEETENGNHEPSREEEVVSPNTQHQVLERSKVRVSFYQGAKAHCVSPPPEESIPYYTMGPVTDLQQTHFDRQLSTESGWDNPFRPDGDLSREADEIVSLIKGGKPITPTPDVGHNDTYNKQSQANQKNISVPDSPDSKKTVHVTQQGVKVSNGTNGAGLAGEHVPPGHVVVQRTTSPEGPQQPQHVTLKKKPKCKCCVIQ